MATDLKWHSGLSLISYELHTIQLLLYLNRTLCMESRVNGCRYVTVLQVKGHFTLPTLMKWSLKPVQSYLYMYMMGI